MRRDIKIKNFLDELGIDGYMKETLCNLLIDVTDIIKENKNLLFLNSKERNDNRIRVAGRSVIT
jgi:hypothetical protein